MLLECLRERLGVTGEPYGSYRFPRLFALEEPSETRVSLRRGRPDDKGAGSKDGEVSISSASPRYRGSPSTPISTLGGLRKCVLSRYSGLMSSDASSGSDDGERRRPFSTSSIL